MYTQCVVLALYVGLAHCFSWDIIINGQTGLNFYDNGTLTHSEDIPSALISSITYDPVHNRVLFASKTNITVISSFDIATKRIQTLVRCKPTYNFKFAYDPPSETVFWIDGRQIYSMLKPGCHDAVGGNSLIQLDNNLWPRGIAVDSCGAYIYWTTDNNIERARFDGSEREVVVNSTVFFRPDLVIDQNTQKIYWIDKFYENILYHISIVSADLNGKNRKTLYSEETSNSFGTISVSKDFIYWTFRSAHTFWQLPKNPAKQFLITHKRFCDDCNDIAVNYQVEDQTQGSQTCAALTSLLPNISSNVPKNVTQLCVHGTQVIGESVCNCTQGYTGERCDVPICQNYCLYGDCSVSDEQPKCRCNAGYSGERCEVDACHKYCLNDGECSINEESEPVCQCTELYVGLRCDISSCQGYCFQGNCSVSAEGHPQCRCNAGYSGERCEVNACLGYCLNNGECSLNADSEPACQCTGDYEGERCEVSVSVFLSQCSRTVSSLRYILNSNVQSQKKSG